MLLLIPGEKFAIQHVCKISLLVVKVLDFATNTQNEHHLKTTIKLTRELPRGCPSPPTPFSTLSGTSMSSKTPGRDFKDIGSLDRVQDVGSS